IVAPRVVAVVLGCRRTRRVGTQSSAKGKIFDVVTESDGEPGAVGPFVLRPLVDRHVVVTPVGEKLHRVLSSTKDPSPHPSPRNAGRGVRLAKREGEGQLLHRLTAL